MANSRIINDFNQDISAGHKEGKSQFNKFGESEVDTSLTTIWSGTTLQAGLYTYPDNASLGVAINMEAVSTSSLDAGKSLHITGLDVHRKLQTEVVVLDGTTPVVTLYKYLRVFRLTNISNSEETIVLNNFIGVITIRDVGDGFIYGHIEDAGLEINQSQMMIYSVPAGHELLLNNLIVSSAGNPNFKLFWSVKDPMKYGLASPFAVKSNFNMSGGDSLVVNIDYPYRLPEGADFEFRGIATGNKSGDVAVNVVGVLNRLKSVPVKITGFIPTAGDKQVTLIWDEFTPSENQDQNLFDFTYYKTATPNKKEVVSLEKDVTGYVVDGLENGEEYTFEIRFVGFDGLMSTATTTTETPSA